MNLNIFDDFQSIVITLLIKVPIFLILASESLYKLVFVFFDRTLVLDHILLICYGY